MKQCPKCSTKNEDTAGFCKSCGEGLTDVAATPDDFSAMAGDFLNKAGGLLSAGAKKAKAAASEGAQKAQKVASEGMAKAQEQHQEKAAQRAEKAKKDGMFVDPSESAVATLGANYMQNILAGGQAKKGYAMLTKKRLYYKGELFSGAGRNLMSIKGEYIVPLDDISMTSFIHGESTGGKLLGLLLILIGVVVSFPLRLLPVGGVIALAGAVFLIKGFLGKSTVFEISFPGGKFRFDVKWYPMADMQDFQRQLHLMKDYIKNV